MFFTKHVFYDGLVKVYKSPSLEVALESLLGCETLYDANGQYYFNFGFEFGKEF